MTVPHTSETALGSFAFVLHSHIPYVLAHGQWPHGTDWLTEVAAESYIPLLDALHELIREGIAPRLTIGLTPILCEQLRDPGFQDEFTDWLEAKAGAAASDARAFRATGDQPMLALANRWRGMFRHLLHQWENVYNRDIVGAFGQLQEQGYVEIITSAATHGYLPLLLTDSAVNAQVKAGIASYERHFGRRPRGFWMPECAYRPRYRWQSPLPEYQTPEPVLRRGIDEFLSAEGIGYTFVDSHIVIGGEAKGVYAERFGALKTIWHQFSREFGPETWDREAYKPYFLASSGETSQAPVAVYSRDVRSSHAVWAADSGYPGDEWYLEFHRTREPGRLRYWRVSQDKANLGTKGLYDPAKAAERIDIHAKHFVAQMRTLLRECADAGEAPIVSAMYDTELFGHWWHEGPLWLKAVLREMATDPAFDLTTCASNLDSIAPDERRERVVALPEGSWGEGGFHWTWLNPETQYIWERIYDAESKAAALVAECGDSEAAARPLRQALRELLLLEASDWPFVTSTKGAPDYAEARVKAHHLNFMLLSGMARSLAEGDDPGPSPWQVLAEIEARDNPFPHIEPEWWTEG